jgi:predicted SprT family Zn-dependent metalloprotease
MKVTNEVKKMCEAEAARCIEVAKKCYPGNASAFKKVNITYDVRGGCAGKAFHHLWTIKLNPILLMENIKEMVENTVSHEVAHLIDKEVHGTQYGRYNRRTGRRNRIVHGPTFKRIQRQFGRCDATFHNMDVSNARVKRKSKPKHIWDCNCGSPSGRMEIGAVRHRNMQTGIKRYWMRGHGHCGGYTYTGLEGKTPKPLAQAALKPKPAKPAPARGSESKLDKCRRVYDPELSRAANIVAFTEEGCTPAGAATYFAKIKKEF